MNPKPHYKLTGKKLFLGRSRRIGFMTCSVTGFIWYRASNGFAYQLRRVWEWESDGR
jgi:hypothetical protein